MWYMLMSVTIILYSLHLDVQCGQTWHPTAQRKRFLASEVNHTAVTDPTISFLPSCHTRIPVMLLPDQSIHTEPCSCQLRMQLQHTTNRRVNMSTNSLGRLMEHYGTSNVTGHHRGPQQKLRAGYIKSTITTMHIQSTRTAFLLGQLYFSSSSVVSPVSLCMCALCVYAMFGHHPHPLRYPCAKFRFCCALHRWASPLRKIAYSITHSVTQSLSHPAIWLARNRIFCFGINCEQTFKK